MYFNSIDYFLFLPIVFFVYWILLKNKRNAQNLFLLAASYIFYGLWDWRFLGLIIFSTILDFIIGRNLELHKEENTRKALLITSLFINLGILGLFKYYDFFIGSLMDLFQFLNIKSNFQTLNLILPVGISFYTFQTLSYTVDIYNKKLSATKDFISFAAFVSFFPQLVAGPIERASNLLPQFNKNRVFNRIDAETGLRQILWGLIKKVVIADNCAMVVNEIFQNHLEYSSITLIIGAIFFAFQIYGDFSGYSDIAIGSSKLLGIDLMKNFAFPYFSRDIAEFWRRWHISLSTWFRDYLYIPIGGSKCNTLTSLRNVIIIFVVSGFWHGANWTFIVWGLLNALFFIPLLLTKNNRKNLDEISENKLLPSLKETFQMFTTFLLTCFAWIFFRAKDIDQALSYCAGILNSRSGNFFYPSEMKLTLILMLLFVIVEWTNRVRNFGIENIDKISNVTVRWAIYFLLLMHIYLFGEFGRTIEFIYFQF